MHLQVVKLEQLQQLVSVQEVQQQVLRRLVQLELQQLELPALRRRRHR